MEEKLGREADFSGGGQQRLMNGLQQVLQMPVYHLAPAIALCAALLMLLTCYSLCGTSARNDQRVMTSKRYPKPAALPPKKKAQKNKVMARPKVE